MEAYSITAASFPTPALALRTADPAEQRRVRGFAQAQASAAEAARLLLAEHLPGARDHAGRVELLRGAYAALVRWRYEKALTSAGRPGHGLRHDPERFRLPIRAGGVNFDRIGRVGRLRTGSAWNPRTRTFDGGRPSPASTIMEAYGEAALARFDAEGQRGRDVLVNVVTLPGGRRVNGNRLVRGAAARRVADRLLARVRARGEDTGQVEVGGELLYAVTADHQDSARILAAALDQLAALFARRHDDQLRQWQTARYLLYQSPVTKKGSDAVIRMFVVAVGALLFGGRTPVMQSDADLRCMILGQAAGTAMPADSVLCSASAAP
ncbi:hypothetical protein [Amycolatopsis rubida]|uniref:Uncharacterized protein n=1 Tax=Amycolatopsis rubida TaxID=112413 RepID=A0A1I5XGW8_9PSEU|nr:hypothetical protein [Amycolatopsis rubida]SFQ31223.1 hypothetical protein SAMN05421854_110226 [Amycolatopsis rubida]